MKIIIADKICEYARGLGLLMSTPEALSVETHLSTDRSREAHLTTSGRLIRGPGVVQAREISARDGQKAYIIMIRIPYRRDSFSTDCTEGLTRCVDIPCIQEAWHNQLAT